MKKVLGFIMVGISGKDLGEMKSQGQMDYIAVDVSAAISFNLMASILAITLPESYRWSRGPKAGDDGKTECFMGF